MKPGRGALIAGLVALLALAGGAWWFVHWRAEPYTEHVVVRGDTLSKLAKRYDVTVEELRDWNGIQGDLIEVDQVLRVYIEPRPDLVSEPTPAAKTRRASRSSSGTTPSVVEGHGLKMPDPEPCVSLDTAIGEQGMVASAGLDRAQVKGALDPILQHALSCQPDEGVTALSLTFSIRVACTGVVDDVDVLDGDVASAGYLDCVRDVLRHADFPAHDLPDGMRFTYPVSASW